MSIKSKSFELVEKKAQILIPKSGRGTSVTELRTLTGAVVEKRVKDDGYFQDEEDVWLDNVFYAKEVSEKIRNLRNPNYFVPKTFVAHGKVREHMIKGTSISDFFSKNKEVPVQAMFSFAHFINDMSELEPVLENPDYGKRLFGIDLEYFIKRLDSYDGEISQKTKKLITKIFKYFLLCPEYKKLVFSHNDLHGGNVFVNEKEKRLEVIDFEMANYAPQLYALYDKKTIGKVFNLVNNLPRTKNPDFKWNYDSKKAQLFKGFRSDVILPVIWNFTEKNGDALKHLKNFEKRHDKYKMLLASVKLEDENQKNTTPKIKALVRVAGQSQKNRM